MLSSILNICQYFFLYCKKKKFTSFRYFNNARSSITNLAQRSREMFKLKIQNSFPGQNKVHKQLLVFNKNYYLCTTLCIDSNTYK